MSDTYPKSVLFSPPFWEIIQRDWNQFDLMDVFSHSPVASFKTFDEAVDYLISEFL